MALAQQCAPTVAPETMAAVISVESGFNPYAIGVVGAPLKNQPKNIDEAIETAKALALAGKNFSVGVMQVNRYNLTKHNLNYEKAFDICSNLYAGSKVLEDCYLRAIATNQNQQRALEAAFSCYYSGNFSRGFKPEGGQPSYVQKVLTSAKKQIVPAINTGSTQQKSHDMPKNTTQF